MKIETKFSIGEHLHFTGILDNPDDPRDFTVEAIYVMMSNEVTDIKYSGEGFWCGEDELEKP